MRPSSIDNALTGAFSTDTLLDSGFEATVRQESQVGNLTVHDNRAILHGLCPQAVQQRIA
jgi:hypothetical protein